MRIGLPKEIKVQESRVAMVPAAVRELVQRGHEVIVEHHAGMGIDIQDDEYIQAGATIVDSAEGVFANAELIVKVKEPQPEECKRLREGQTLFTYLHLAPDPQQADLLQASGVTAIAYETVTADDGSLPLLTPMSQVAGRMAIQAGAHCLEKPHGGRGVLLGGVPGVASANVVIIGGGIVGTNALRIAMGMEARVTVLDKSLSRLNELDHEFGCRINTIFASTESIENYVRHADLVVGAVLVPGAAAPKLVKRSFLAEMKPGAVLVDVAIDQGGCFESSRPTTHAEPTYIENNIVHYCVTNMPGAVPRTAAFALNNATFPYILALAEKGVQHALRDDVHLLNGLNVYQGRIVHPAVAEGLNKTYVPALDVLGV